MSLRRREFPEVLENLLTSISKGVAGESHPFPPPNGLPYRHDLQQPPVADVASVYGSRDGQPHLFRKDVDYRLLEGTPRQTVEWQREAQAQWPDPGTLIQVNYYPESAQPVLTDLYTGSVVRTLSESIALEISRLYAQLEAVYRSGFVDTATGAALDNVVALLGVERVAGGHAAGEVELTRSPGSRGIINIPTGTRVITADGSVEYETTETVTLAEGQNNVRVVARDVEEDSEEHSGLLPADALTVLPVPIAGIEGVTNPAPTAITRQGETDAALRDRARSFLHGSERATLGAIKQIVARHNITADVVEVPDTPGRVEITPHTEDMPPELHQRLLTAIEESRPAGVVVMLRGARPPRKVNLELRLTTASGLLEQDVRAAQRAVREKIEEYFARLPVGEAGSINRMVGQVLSTPGVQDMRLLSATWTVDGTSQNVLNAAAGRLDIGGFPTVLGELHIADPNLPTLLGVVVTYPEDKSPPDRPAMQAAMTNTLAYLNEANASELPSEDSDGERARRVLSYGKLLYVLPLPNKQGAVLKDYDDAVTSGEQPPSLPTQANPYGVQFAISLESGLSRIISGAADPGYVLTPFERLSLSSLEMRAEGG